MPLRIAVPDCLVVMCDRDKKEFMLAADPEIYYQTDHYRGSAAVLVNLAVISRDDVRLTIE